MRLTKSLLCGISALALATGAAFAGEDSAVYRSAEASPPQLLSDDSYALERPSDMLALEEGDVIYIYPMEVTEYYLLIPSESSETAG